MEILSNNLYYKQEFREVVIDDGYHNYTVILRKTLEDNVEEKVLENLPDSLIAYEKEIINLIENETN